MSARDGCTLIKRQQAYAQSFQFGDRPLRHIVNPNVDHLRTVLLDTAQRNVHPSLRRPRPDSSEIPSARWADRSYARRSLSPAAIKHNGIGMQARIQKRGVHQVLRHRQTVRKPHFGKRLVLTNVQFPHPAEAGTVFKPELVQPIVEIGNRQCLLATRLDLFRRKASEAAAPLICAGCPSCGYARLPRLHGLHSPA